MSGTNHLGDVLSALLDGELDPAEEGAARQHLAGCAQCRDEHDATASVRATLRAIPPVDPPFGLVERLLVPGALDGGPHHRQRTALRRGRRRPPVWAAGVAAAAALVALALTPRHAPSVQPPVATFIDAHTAASPGPDPVSGLAPVATPVSFRSP